MYIFDYEQSDINMFVIGKVIDRTKSSPPKVKGVFYDSDDGLGEGEIGYLPPTEFVYETAGEAMKKAIPYIFEQMGFN